MHIRMIVGAAAIALLSSCQTRSYLGNENSPHYVVPAGSRVTLTQALKIPPDQLAVYVQNGRVLRNVEVLHDSPFCKFELDRLSAIARDVQPDELLVTRSAQERSRGVASLPAPVQLATSGDVPSIESLSTRMDLRSGKQPEVARLTCARWGYPGFDEHVSIAEMRQTLSGLFTLRLPHQ
jgi:hypothetical protein